MHVISTDGTFIFASPSVDTLCGYDPEELRGQNFFDFLHPSDVEPFKREFFHCLASPKNTSTPSSPERLTAHYRFKTKDERHVLFEVTGHFFSGSTISPTPTGSSSSSSNASSSNPSPVPPAGGGGSQPKCFFGLARPYPSRSIAMLDSFLELKMENERLRQELLILYEEIEGEGALSPSAVRLQQEQQRASESIPLSFTLYVNADSTSLPKACQTRTVLQRRQLIHLGETCSMLALQQASSILQPV